MSRDEPTVYVANLPWDTTEDDLVRLFGQLVTVVDARVIQDLQTGRSRGYGYAKLATLDQVSAVCATLNGCRFNGRCLEVRPARSTSVRQQLSTSPDLPSQEDRCMRELVTMMVRALVDDPEQVTVNQVERERSIIFEVRVAPDDFGKVIGKGGRTANALRTLIRAAGTRERKSVWVDLNKHGEWSAVADQ
jgi:predicted RNA-binding protein YlqC (UPF0109 family)